MASSRIVGVVGLLVLGIGPGTLLGQTLRERIAARRAATVAKARAEIRARGGAPLGTPYDPDTDPQMWRIRKFTIAKGEISTGLGFLGGRRRDTSPQDDPESRFHAEARPGDVPESLGDGTSVFFYTFEDDRVTLAGRGVVRRIRGGRRKKIVEAEVQSFVHAERKERFLPGILRVSAGYALGLVRGRSPKRERWYMSLHPKGPDTNGWEQAQVENFAFGNPWQGMSVNALLALLGPPDSKLLAGGKQSLVWGQGPEARRFTVADGKVMDMTVGQF